MKYEISPYFMMVNIFLQKSFINLDIYKKPLRRIKE
jgi:hypothetical protein